MDSNQIEADEKACVVLAFPPDREASRVRQTVARYLEAKSQAAAISVLDRVRGGMATRWANQGFNELDIEVLWKTFRGECQKEYNLRTSAIARTQDERAEA